MKKINYPSLAFISLVSMFFISCDYGNLDKRENDVQLPVVPYSYNMGVDDNMPTLGRVLFYDPRLSANNTVRLVYVVSAPLTVSARGGGGITPNYNHALLQVEVRSGEWTEGLEMERCELHAAT